MLPTLRSNAAVGHETWAVCKDCQHSRILSLADLERRVLADTPLAELRLRCQCGSKRVSTVVSGARHAGYVDNGR